MNLYFGITLPVNPAEVSPALTIPQVWQGLMLKARHPQPFAPVEECTITEDRGEAGITRRVKFIDREGPVEDEVTEVISYFKHMKVDFQMLEKPFHVSNIISSGHGDQLYLTFSFSNEFPSVEEGSSEALYQTQSLKTKARKAVQQTIDVIRQLVIDGKL